MFENDPVYKEYMGIYDEMEKNATPAGQELLKQQYEALEFTLQGYASEFVDTVLVQPGQLNPFGYENTSKSAWASYEAHADKYAGREFILPLEQAEYERVTKRAEELYKTYEEAENKTLDDQRAFLDANNKRGDICLLYTSDAADE